MCVSMRLTIGCLLGSIVTSAGCAQGSVQRAPSRTSVPSPGEDSASSAEVVRCALALLGRSAARLPPIKVLPAPPRGSSLLAQGLADSTEGVIYLIRSAPAFREAEAAARTSRGRGQCFARAALKMVASVIVHEEWHLMHGADERNAYLAQLTELNRLGLGPGSRETHAVTMAMQAAIRIRDQVQRDAYAAASQGGGQNAVGRSDR